MHAKIGYRTNKNNWSIKQILITLINSVDWILYCMQKIDKTEQRNNNKQCLSLVTHNEFNLRFDKKTAI